MMVDLRRILGSSSSWSGFFGLFVGSFSSSSGFVGFFLGSFSSSSLIALDDSFLGTSSNMDRVLDVERQGDPFV